MVKSNSTIGFYGKLPIIGDFASRRLPEHFINSWDAWLQSGLAASQEELGENWLSSYLTSPIWRFLLSPGVCGAQAIAGILMPSVDRVGRYFPMTVAGVFEEAPSLPVLLVTGNDWFEQLEAIALSGLEGSLDLNAFDELLQKVPEYIGPKAIQTESAFSTEKKLFSIAMDAHQNINGALTNLNTSLLTTFMPGHTLWSTAGSKEVQPALLACQGLPSISWFSEIIKSKTVPTVSVEELPQIELVNNYMSEILTDEADTLSSILNSEKIEITSPQWHSWALTDQGLRRPYNEDALLNKPEVGLWVVADGMGGHQAGDIASNLIVTSLNELDITGSLEVSMAVIEEGLQSVNTQLRELGVKEFERQIVGSTVVALIAKANRCGFLWAGDSRLYLFRNNSLQQLSRDHCLDEDEITSEWSVKSNNVITRAIGAEASLILDSEVKDLLEGDVFLLCSDGLDKELTFKEIEQIMQDVQPKELVNTLMAECLTRGARDNVSIIVVTPATIL